MSDIPKQAAAAPRAGVLDWLRGQLRNVAPFATLIVLVAFFWAASDSFATLGDLENILTQISVTGIIAVGLTFVILCAEIDLSVASIANATGIVVVSTEPETVLSLADRIVVMKKGRVVREFADEPVSKDRLLEAA